MKRVYQIITTVGIVSIMGAVATHPIGVHALGISATPSEINLTTRVYQPTYKTVVVKNPSSETAVFDFFVDDFEDIIRVRPKNMILASGEEKRVAIEMLPSREGIFTTDISIVARSLSSQSLRSGAGLKVPMTLTVQAQTQSRISWMWLVIAADAVLVALFILGVWLLWYRNRKRR